ncbi:endoplasmic reticulum-golgi intermediate compartment protein [Anaeramoeba flamelloides]|uniref:Endoplasmic reticulum-golgi intermediate compartment protein n=1 Tax=Anaeramoeba flamelloides TaxID=1746091 RepID=A0AAV7YSY2_9EUKA|nr:endoplasmic reticulum-golgi intermediate compartment protein [Anaeramoeba flamelloides]
MYRPDLVDRLRRIDLFPKYVDSASVKTKSGAFLSIVSYLLLAFLFLNEFRLFIANDAETKLTIDSSSGPSNLDIHLNMSFPNLKCGSLHVDVLDQSGARHLNIKQNLIYQPLDENGMLLVNKKKGSKTKENYCGSCFGAEQFTPSGCCNTCQEVKEAYYKAGWKPTESEFEQCTNQRFHEEDTGIGCLLRGSLKVNKVDGGFHIAPGFNVIRGSQHLHNIGSIEKEGKKDCSHIIHDLTIGKQFKGSNSPLSHTKNIYSRQEMMFQYFLKIVPTFYQKKETFQYSAYQFSREINRIKSNGIPGVFFSYDFTPIVIQIDKKNKNFFHFVTQSLSLLGGVYTVSFVLDRFIFTLWINRDKKDK